LNAKKNLGARSIAFPSPDTDCDSQMEMTVVRALYFQTARIILEPTGVVNGGLLAGLKIAELPRNSLTASSAFDLPASPLRRKSDTLYFNIACEACDFYLIVSRRLENSP
jgi:hypothetical protein